MTPFTVCYVERNSESTVYRVAWVADGLHRSAPVGPEFSKPYDAVRYAERLERQAQKESVA